MAETNAFGERKRHEPAVLFGTGSFGPGVFRVCASCKIPYSRPVSANRNIQNIALIGFMGTGKTTVGRIVADQLKFDLLDTDALIEQRSDKKIIEIFAQNGEATFRQLEAQLVAELATRTRTVISTGGGLPTNPENLDSLKQHSLIVCLWASPEGIYERVREQSHRPLLNDPDPLGQIRALLTAREPHYRQADVLINSDLRSAREVAQQVINQYRLVTGPRK
jgi:shikimate kinase